MAKRMNHHFPTCDLRNWTGFSIINKPLFNCFERIYYRLASRFIEDYSDFCKIERTFYNVDRL